MNEKAKLLRDYGRMCKTVKCESGDCGLRDEFGHTCNTAFLKYHEKAVEIIEVWAKENPERTYTMDFLEKFPKAKRDWDGLPCFCVQELGYIKRCPDIALKPCEECWNQPMEES